MTITPTPLTAALAGVFSAMVWPWLWSRFGPSTSAGTFELVIGTLLVIVLPAHAFVVGFSRSQTAGKGMLDTALLKRVGVWLVAAVVTAVVASAIRA